MGTHSLISMLHQYQIEIKISINIEFMQTHLLFFAKNITFICTYRKKSVTL